MIHQLTRILILYTRDVQLHPLYYALDPTKYIKTVQRDLNYVYREYHNAAIV